MMTSHIENPHWYVSDMCSTQKNINTVDASGFEELLVRSRGTITQLINNAVNEKGRSSII